MPIPSLPATFTRPSTPRHCFVTVGATVTFSALLSAIQHEAFLSALILSGFTHLTVQAGRDYDAFCAFSTTVDARFLTVECFDLKDSLARDMALCRADAAAGRAAGVVISHAGTGSVLDAMTAQAPLIVVPNEALLDNHQVELAKMVESRHYGVSGTLTTLIADIPRAHAVHAAYNQQFQSTPASLCSTAATGKTKTKNATAPPTFWGIVDEIVQQRPQDAREIHETEATRIEG